MENHLRIAFGLFFLVTINSEIIELSEKIVHVGESISLSCTNDQVTRDGAAAVFSWFFNNERINSDEHHEQEDKVLLLKNVLKNMTGYYGCVVELGSSGARFETSKMFIKVIDLRTAKKKENHHDKLDSVCNFRIPKLCRNKRNKKEESLAFFKFTPKPVSRNFEMGSSAKIHCKANGSTKIYWTKDDDGDEDEKLSDDVVDVNGTLIFNNIASNHKGLYTCHATNGIETIKHQIEVGILPQFKITPQDYLEVVELQSVLIDCVGSDNSTVKWDFETTMINSENDDRFHIYENGSLLLHEARQDDSGRYGCTIGNSAGFKRSESHLVIKQMDSHTSFEESEEESSLLISKAVIMTCLVALIYISLVVVLMLWCRHKRQKSRNSDDLENGEKENDDTASDGDEKEPLNLEARSSSSSSRKHKDKHNNTKKSKPLSSSSFINCKDHLMIRFDQIIDLTKIGSGEFGEILTGALNDDADLPLKINNIKENGADEIRLQQQIKVLVKSISENNKNDQLFVEFRRQIELYRSVVDSQNVVKLFGLCLEKDMYYMILEHDRDLKSFLQNDNSNASVHQLLKFCRQIASGLHYIAKSKLTHRDVALRNCIITNDGVIKLTTIASNNTHEYYKYNDHFLPLRHLAPELFDSFVYSAESDVYSCGITFWEVFHQGEVPFAFLNNDEYFKKLQNKSIDYAPLLESKAIPSELHKILKNCWTSSVDRPTSDDLIKNLDELIAESNGKDIS